MISAGDRGALARAFLDELFGVRAIGHIELRCFTPGGRCYSRWFRSVPHAAAFAIAADDAGEDVQVGVGLRRQRGRTARDVVALGCAWADLDAHVALEDFADALIALHSRLLGLPVAPSMVVFSGHGYHPYWLLEAAAPVPGVCAISAALTERLGGDPAAVTAARLLRIPGTHNRKSEPVRAYVFGDWWRPGRHARRYRFEELVAILGVALPKPATEDEPGYMPEVLEAVLTHGYRGRKLRNGRVTLCCPFHDDAQPSGVVFPNGWFHCSACGVDEPAGAWTQRPEVASWELKVCLKTTEGLHPSLPAGYLKAPKSAITTVGPLLYRKHAVAVERRGRRELRLVDAKGTNVPFDDPEALGVAVRDLCGPLAFRMFWVCIALAQIDHAAHGARGRFAFSLERAAELLGFARGKDRLCHNDQRAQMIAAIEGLARLFVRFRWSSRTPWFHGPIAVRLGEFSDGGELFHLHPGLWRQIIGSAPAWTPWHPAALRLEDDALAVYFVARWLHRRAAERHGEVSVEFDLQELAERAGAWNAARFSKDRGRYLAEWRRRLSQIPELGWSLVGEGGRLLRVQPAGGESYGADKDRERGALAVAPANLTSLPDHSTAIRDFSIVSPNLQDRIPRVTSVFPRVTSVGGGGGSASASGERGARS